MQLHKLCSSQPPGPWPLAASRWGRGTRWREAERTRPTARGSNSSRHPMHGDWGMLTWDTHFSKKSQQSTATTQRTSPHMSAQPIHPCEPYAKARDTSGFLTSAYLGVQTVKRGRTAIGWRNFALYPEYPGLHPLGTHTLQLWSG